MRLRPSFLAALALLLAAASACTSLKQLAASGLASPEVALTAISAQGLDLSGVTMLVRLRVDNPNNVALDLESLTYKLAIEGEQVFEGVMPEGLKLAARGPTPVELPVRLSWLDLPKVARAFLSKPEVAARVSGTAGIGTAFGVLDVPFQHTEQVRTTVR